jgi:hypothetical protein
MDGHLEYQEKHDQQGDQGGEQTPGAGLKVDHDSEGFGRGTNGT